VVSLRDYGAFVDLGGLEGMLDRAELVEDDGSLGVKVGDDVRAHVVKKGDGPFYLRKRLGKNDEAQEAIRQAFEHKIPIEGKVTAVNRGGLDVEVAGSRAFCPKSQVDLMRIEDFTPYVGREMTFLVTKFEAPAGGRPDIVVSRRAILEQERSAKAEVLRESLAVGATMKGTVVSLRDYGAFVDLGGLEGMLHVSELAHHRVRHPKELLSIGEEVDVKVIDLQPSRDPNKPERISLSLKALEQDPWERAPRPGAKIKGKVMRLETFGAFVEIEAGVEGLVHISELVEGRRIQHPKEVVDVGHEVEVVVLAVDHDRRRLSLSCKAVAEVAEQSNVQSYQSTSATKSGGQSLGTFGDLLGDLGDKLKR
ncbi:MAG: S1 RNA-binding domain-containing protein, partial [Myxococcota bacterium]